MRWNEQRVEAHDEKAQAKEKARELKAKEVAKKKGSPGKYDGEHLRQSKDIKWLR